MRALTGLIIIWAVFLQACRENTSTTVQGLQADSMKQVAGSVLQRLAGDHFKAVTLEVIKKEGTHDVFETSATGGTLTVRGSSPSALCYGFYKYIQDNCNAMVSWSGQHLPLPDSWPDQATKRVVCPYQYRYFLNVVTFGYTTPYWDWARWEKELDWMALHGINMALAPVASEAIAERVWKKMGLKDEDISSFFTGPAYLPWHRMGNLNHWDGPFPKGWHDDQVALQHKILARMRELGITPIAPAFAGFVPEAFQEAHPELGVKKLKWGGFPEEDNAYVLAPNTPFFTQIGKLFINEWEKEFGRNIYYLSDSFNEMELPVDKDDPQKKYGLLADYGEAIWKSISAGNPDAVWVTQGWTFGYQHDFWDTTSLKSLLSKVPDDHMMIVDLGNEYPPYVWNIAPVWQTHKGFYGKQWIYSFVPNFGGKTPYTGVLDLYASGPAKALASPYSKTEAGFGSAPEGLENNEVIYELLADLSWADSSISLHDWLPAYCRHRYGGSPEKMVKAWEQLRATCYNTFSPYPRFVWQLVTPDMRRRGKVNDDSLFLSAVENFLDCSDELQQSELYRNDAIELSVFYLGIKADNWYKQALKADSLGQTTLKSELGGKAVKLLLSVDSLLASHPSDRLATWVNYARSHGATTEEKDYYESDAKRLITTWGGLQDDYAARIWSGLIRSYYIPRMQLQLSGREKRLPAWEEQWIQTPFTDTLTPMGDPVKRAKELVDAIR